MTELKRYWMIVHYETEFEAENEDEAYHDIRLGNTIIENATVVAKELPESLEGDHLKEIINEAKLEARREAAVSILLAQLARKTEDYALRWEGLSKLTPQRQEQIEALSVEQLESLSIDAIAFSSMADLEGWLDRFSG
ncbi:MAG: DUF4351 domain-containing protein [Moorea sp. SIO2I5]|nr:DUF4351 domain-containing protein [Moorena sp. SIO2I5]